MQYYIKSEDSKTACNVKIETNSEVTCMKNEPEDYKPFQSDCCRNTEAGSSCSEEQTLKIRTCATDPEPSHSAIDFQLLDRVPGAERLRESQKCESNRILVSL